MAERWAAKVRGEMLVWDITSDMLAREMDITPQYLSAVFNGRKPATALKPRILETLTKMIERRKNEHGSTC